jgi:hypothetical protein
LSPGAYTVQYKAIGYRQESRAIDLSTSKTLNIVLQTESYQLKAVSINAGGEDPAYAIIRKAIKKRKQHHDEVNAYTYKVYIKGLQRLISAPDVFMGFNVKKATRESGLDSNKGILYLSESESQYSFQRPDNVHEVLLSSKVSGNNKAFTYNRASDMTIDFYQNTQTWEGVSNRPIISPIADNALFYYRYKLVGTSVENGETVNKIRVTPKRGYDACMQGYIYILDDSWRIYSVNLHITKKQNLNFVDTLNIAEQYFPVSDKAWMTSTVKLDFKGGFLGFKFGGYYIAVHKDYDLNPTFTKNEFKEVLRIPKDATKNDSAFWVRERPIPLTQEETTDYKKKEALAKKRESKTYLDSLDKVNNRFNPIDVLLGSYYHRDRYKHEYYTIDPVLTSIKYNTVQGFSLTAGATFSKQIDSINNRYLVIGAKAGYGFSDKKFTGLAFTDLPVGKYTLGLSGGSVITDLNNQSPISPLINTLYSLFERQNFEKLYQKQFAAASLSGRIIGPLKASATAEWADRTWLPNTSSYSFYSPDNHQYSSNNPLIPTQDVPLFPGNQSFKITLRATYDFSDKYETFPSGRRYLPSPYPTIGISYTKGINGLLGSDVDYDLLSADVSKTNINAGIFGFTSFYLGAGKFLNNDKLYYPDYQQFLGNQVLFYNNSVNSFLLLNYYNFSTYTEFVQGHFEQNFSGFFLNKIPLLRKLRLQEIVDVNYLSTTSLKNYTELGFGVQYLGFRLMYGRSFNNGSNTNSALRLGLSF